MGRAQIFRTNALRATRRSAKTTSSIPSRLNGSTANSAGGGEHMRKQFLSVLLLVLGLIGCSAINARVVTTPNRAAMLQGNLPADPMQWQVITSEIDPRQSTMSTVFGNDVAVEYARTHDDHNYPTGP